MRLPDTVEHVPVAALAPYARNARTHSPAQVAQIAASIREFGFTNPVLIDGGDGIIAGHGRVMAAQELRLVNVPCIRLAHLTEAQKRAYIIADNQLALNAGWDEALLKLEVADLDAMDYDLGLLGFDGDRLDELLAPEATEGDNDGEQVPPVQADAVTTFNDIWQLGRHRLICGDSSQADVVNAVLDGASIELIVFDPPYDQPELYKSIPAPVADQKLMVFWNYKIFGLATECAMAAGWKPQYELIWDCVTSWYTPNRPLQRHKTVGVFGDCPKWKFDAAIIRDGKKRTAGTVSNSRGSYEYEPLEGAVHMRTVESFPTTQESGGHEHSKPVQWITAILNGLNKNWLLDLFCGSGTTIIAAEQTGRICYAIELSPHYVDVAVRRWQQFTGQAATLDGDGRTFDAIAAERGDQQ